MVPCISGEADCRKCFERILVEYCAPTLAGLKASNLVNISFFRKECLAGLLDEGNAYLGAKGMRLRMLVEKEDHALVLVYRTALLEKQMADGNVQRFLHSYGYRAVDLEEDLDRLSKRMERDSFPHEIGVFLGYPLEDVKGFILNKGEKPLLSGYWKVYSSKEETAERFRKMDLCRKKYMECYQRGSSLYSLAV